MNIDDLKEHIKITVTQHDIDVAWIPEHTTLSPGLHSCRISRK